ncbi:hypothetical protein [Geothrix sp. PMB-07]|uniref:hypothetical protein n=1 Tax=Geothrix sp. PMB-07 TaxID=3068640 RepID=UPI002740FC40|nr:hypothetical protein [Geothrix sp. PMB-07]WLT32791.1 hypothetical protein Q9293_05520 [Geothrix sp. PMB-07]
MTHVCSWCKTNIYLEEDPESFGGVTHGICQACARKLFQEIPIQMDHYLNEMDTPVLLVNQDITTTFANQSALQMLGAGDGELSGLKLGAVLLCPYAQLKEGCGRQIHCSGCTIRRCVEITRDTGAPFFEVPVTLSRAGTSEPSERPFLLSSIRLGSMVVLKLDPLAEA